MTHNIDLIPNDYRQAIVRNKHMQRSVWIVLGLCTVIVAASGVVMRTTKDLKGKSDQMRSSHASASLYRDQIQVVDDRLKALQEEWLLLQGLRSGAAVEDIFVIIDQALPGNDVWFVDWTFRRAGVIHPETQEAVNSGYFIVVPKDANQTDQTILRVATHMDIVGQARDHAALSKFVRGLYAQGEIQNVKLSHTKVREYANRTVVDFELAIILFSEPAV